MPTKKLKLQALRRLGVLAVFCGIAGSANAQSLCSISTLVGTWAFNESGEGPALGPWSEIGTFTLRRDGTGLIGSGVAVITAPSVGVVGAVVQPEHVL